MLMKWTIGVGVKENNMKWGLVDVDLSRVVKEEDCKFIR